MLASYKNSNRSEAEQQNPRDVAHGVLIYLKIHFFAPQAGQSDLIVCCQLNRAALVKGLMFLQLKTIPCTCFSGSVFGELAGEEAGWECQPHYLQVSSQVHSEGRRNCHCKIAIFSVCSKFICIGLNIEESTKSVIPTKSKIKKRMNFHKTYVYIRRP